MGFKAEASIAIDRSPTDVWEYVLHHNDWRKPEVLQVRQLSEGPPGVGTRYEDRVRMMGREMTVINQVLQFEPPRYVSWTEVGGDGPVYAAEGSYRLERLDGKTRFTLTSEYWAEGLWRLLLPLVGRQLENNLYPRYLRQLKQILESEQEGG